MQPVLAKRAAQVVWRGGYLHCALRLAGEYTGAQTAWIVNFAVARTFKHCCHALRRDMLRRLTQKLSWLQQQH
jgi:hypothetical protein